MHTHTQVCVDSVNWTPVSILTAFKEGRLYLLHLLEDKTYFALNFPLILAILSTHGLLFDSHLFGRPLLDLLLESFD